MFLVGLFIHIVFLVSVFDIYFKSPIVKNVAPYQPIHEAPANRLVLFVVDGLRAESFLNYTTMPYLRSVANTIGRWGISHTRVPTESRPGHVAIIAGFYEDPSAVAKGWKENPVDFDSVLNQTSHTWCWGTYDILEVFTKDESNNHIYADKMDPYDESFSSNKNTTNLDEWVFVRVKEFFQKAKYDSEVYKKLQQNKIVFFLHLLGTDTSGHTHKPKTQNFLTTVKFVDEHIKEMEKIIKDFYNNDGRTTFLMTSDHGMTDWGSHGTGDNHETETPYVLWGAGVKEVETEVTQNDAGNYEMSLDNRFDINQADLSPLMSTFLSIPVPVNSIGRLPIELLNMSLPNKAKSIYSNCIQMISQYNKKKMDIEAHAISFLYHPYEPLDTVKLEETIHVIEILLSEEKYDSLIIFCDEIMNLSLNGLSYYHNYYQKPLLITISLSFLGWIVYLLKVLLKQRITTQTDFSNTNKLVNASRTIDIIFKFLCMLTAILAIYLIYAQNLPIQYYIYFLMPICLWMYAVTPVKLWIETIVSFKYKNTVPPLVVQILCYTLGSIALGVAFSHRWVLSIPLIGMSLWPFFSSLKHNLRPVYIAWPAGCLMLSMFSFMPVVGKDVCIELVIVAGLIWLVGVSLYLWKTLWPNYNENQEIKREVVVSVIQITLLAISLQIIYLQSGRFTSELPISKTLQLLCWVISVTLPLYPLLHTTKFINRLMGINTSILNFYLLLSVSHEGLFMVILMFSVNCWMVIEFQLLNLGKIQVADCSFELVGKGKSEKSLDAIERCINDQDFRRAFFFTLYIILSYFGTGNIASLNSFEVRWVLCFTTSFQPFVMTILILLKTIAPFLSVSCTFRAIQIVTKAPMGCLNIMVLIFSNIMGIHMLYHVKNTGSWLEIGTSISQYVIVQAITLFIVLINQIAKILTEIELCGSILKLFKNTKKYV